MIFLLDYWKEFAIAALVGVLLYFGYHLHTLTDAAHENASLRTQLAEAQKAPAALMKFDQDFNKEIKNAKKKDDCFGRPLPASGAKLLH